MRVRYRPEGGRFGYGFDYFCAECGMYVGNSLTDDQLQHPATEKIGKMFRKIEVPITCSNAGKVRKMPVHEIDTTELEKERK